MVFHGQSVCNLIDRTVKMELLRTVDKAWSDGCASYLFVSWALVGWAPGFGKSNSIWSKVCMYKQKKIDVKESRQMIIQGDRRKICINCG